VAAAAPVAAAPAAPAAPAGSGNAVPSPLPGTVVEVKATVGQTVKRGDVVMLIEAMKMENEISAPTDGKIVSILVQKGSKVEQGTPIFEIG
jgi:biotin carboxyl carrier protein